MTSPSFASSAAKKVRRLLALILFILLFMGAGYVCVRYYGYIFAKTVKGKIERVEKVSPVESIITSGGGVVPASQLFSFAVAVKADNSNEIHTASSEDRQWAVAREGQCVEAKFFPYAPWQFDKAQTYYGARLVKLWDCQP